MRNALLLTALVLVSVLAGAASAQDTAPTRDAVGPVHMRLEPEPLQVFAGRTAVATLVLNNTLDRDVVLSLATRPEAGDLSIKLTDAPIKLIARGSARIQVEVAAAFNATPGPTRFTVVATEGRDTTTDAVSRATFGVRIAPDPAPRVEPDHLIVDAVPGNATRARLLVGNPLPREQIVAVSFDLPDGWNVVVPRTFVLPAGGHTIINATFRATSSAENGTGALTLSVRDAQTVVPITLLIRAPDGGANFVAPPGPEIRPTVDPPPLDLTLEPLTLDVPLGGSAIAHITVTNPTPRASTFTFEADLPDGFTAELVDEKLSIPPGDSRRFAVLVRDERTDPAVGEHAATFHVLHHDSQNFKLRSVDPATSVVTAAPPVDRTTLVIAAGAGAVGGVALGLSWMRRRWPFAFAALYTRLVPSRLLKHPLRDRIVAAIREAPGITFSELRRALDIGAGALTHHARTLERGGYILSKPFGQERRFYLMGTGRVEGAGTLAERAMHALREQGALTPSDLARELGVTRQALHYHVKKMVASGEWVQDDDGRVALAA